MNQNLQTKPTSNQSDVDLKVSTRIPQEFQRKGEKEKTSVVVNLVDGLLGKKRNEEFKALTSNHDNAMIQWAKEGFAEGVRTAVSYGVSQAAANTALYMCAGQNEVAPEKYIETMKILIEDAGAKVNICCGSETPLIHACKKNNVEIAKFLISAGAFVNSNYGLALKNAVKNNNLEMTKTLIASGAFVSVDNGQLFINAIKNNNVEILKCLVLGYPTQEVSEKAFKYAVLLGNKECAKIIAQNMKDVSPYLREIYTTKFDSRIANM